jgi:hypothetical protein
MRADGTVAEISTHSDVIARFMADRAVLTMSEPEPGQLPAWWRRLFPFAFLRPPRQGQKEKVG